MSRNLVARSVGLVVALYTLLGVGEAQAQGRARPCSEDGKTRAQALIAQGTRALRKGKAQQAVAAFRRAYRHCRARAIQFNLALAHQVLGHRVTAAKHLRRYLAGAPPSARKLLPPPLQQLLLEVGVIQVRLGLPRATLWVDGRLAGAGTVEVVVLPGRRALEIRLGDKVLKHKQLLVAGGQTILWSPRVRLPRPSPRLHPRPRPRPAPPPVRKKGVHWGYFVAAAVVAVASGATLTYTGVRTLQLKQDYSDTPTSAIEKNFNRYKLVSNVLVGVTAGVVITAGIIALFTRWRGDKRERSHLSATPIIAPGAAGLLLQGRY